MAMSELKQKLLKYELKKIGFPEAVYVPESDQIKLQPDNTSLITINDAGDINYGLGYGDFAIITLFPIVEKVNESAAAWGKSNEVPFEDLSKFRVLAEYNNIILAARDDTIYGRGFHFVTWQYNYDRTGLDHGHYTEDYNIIKEDFAVRSGLISKEKIFTREQAEEIITAIENLMENDYDLYLTYEKTDLLNEIVGNLRDAYSIPENKIEEEMDIEPDESQIEITPTSRTIFGDVQPGDWVIAAGNNEHRYLLGTVTAIDKFGSPEHDTENETDDIHIDFTAFEYPPDRIAEIEEHFSDLYGEPKTFAELPLDDVIMSPKMLIRITHLGQDEIEFMGNLRINCESFCKCFPGGNEPLSAKHSELIERLNQNLGDYHNMLDGFGNRELIEMADKISAMSNAHIYMTGYEFDDSELDFYLQFQNPLEVVADVYCENDLGDLSFALDYVNDHRDEFFTSYPLIRDVETPADTSLRRYMDIDLELYLGKIAEKVIIHYPKDWEIDKKTLHNAAISDNPEDKRLMWHVCGYGTHLNTERDTFIKDTGAFNTWVDYRKKDEDMFGYIIEVTGYDDGILKGNVFEVGDYYAHSLYVCDTALALDSVALTYSNEWGANAGKTVHVPRYQYDNDRHRLMSESGNVIAIRYYPSESVREMSDLLRQERAKRMALPIGSTSELLRKMADKLSEIRQPMDIPDKTVAKPKTLEEKLRAANEKVKAQEAHNNNNEKSHKRAERE